jgi:hypothetical protein
MAGLLGKDRSEIEADLARYAQYAADRFRAVVALKEHKHLSPARQVNLACAARAMWALKPQDRGTYWLVLSPACWPVTPIISPQRARAFTCTVLRAPTYQEVSALSDFLRVRYRVKSRA